MTFAKTMISKLKAVVPFFIHNCEDDKLGDGGHLNNSVASSSLAKQRSIFPDSNNCRSGTLNFLTICPRVDVSDN